jgi:RHS repeat-associated protein
VYRYNGKELDEATGLYDYGARYYDPAVGRFVNVDPLADQFAPWSPYNYGYDNPIRFTDPDGQSAENCCDPPVSEENTYFEVTKEIQGAVAGALEKLDGLYVSLKASVTSMFTSTTGVETSLSASVTFKLSDAVADMRPAADGSVISPTSAMDASAYLGIFSITKTSVETPLDPLKVVQQNKSSTNLETGETIASSETTVGMSKGRYSPLSVFTIFESNQNTGQRTSKIGAQAELKGSQGGVDGSVKFQIGFKTSN